MNKKVICFTQGYSNILKDTEEIAAKYRNNFTTISSEYLFNKENLLLKQSAIQIPIILVGGLLMEADVTEVVYELTETLKNKNFNVMTYTNNIVNTIWNAKTLTPIFLNKTITESGKISSIKSVIKRDIYKERPDVIIIEAPDAIMQYNDYIHNGYGILTYMLSQSINIDYFICCIPFELADNSLLSNISQDLEAKSGYSINAVHASNIILDTADTLQRKEISIIHTPLSQVKHHLEAILQENIPIVNVFNDGMDKFLKILIEV